MAHLVQTQTSNCLMVFIELLDFSLNCYLEISTFFLLDPCNRMNYIHPVIPINDG
jgi:hypothetical protein